MKNQMVPVITIDGPSGAGKGTIAQMLALDLNWNILDSGALYRTLAYFMSEQDISLNDFEENKEFIKENFIVQFDPGTVGEPVKVIFNDKDITSKVRTEEMAMLTSNLAADPLIREFIKPCQREFMTLPGLVADGRDMGTKVFFKADIKFYLTASVEKRAERRLNQLKDQGISANLPNLIQRLLSRDKADTERLISPLMPAKDAIIIDTSDIDASEVFNITINKIRETLKII